LYPHEENEVIFRQVAATGEPYLVYAKPFEYPEFPERGVTYWDWSLYPVRDGKGQVEALVLYLLEVTDRVRAQQAVASAELQLQEQRTMAIHADRLRSLGEMAAGIAHELNQPLMGIRNMSEHMLIALQKGWDLPGDKVAEKVTDIIDQVDRMSHVIDHARIFARGGADDFETQAVNVNEVIRDAVSLVGAQLRSRGIELVLELAPGLPAVTANQFSLEEVVLNLINNARDAAQAVMERGETRTRHAVILRTGVAARPEGELVKIEVADQGTGMSPETLARAFEPFFSTKDPGKGTGLGLSICRSILERMDGEIEIDSEPGAGTVVTVMLPVNRKG
jgi:signal transduction histidine kinase